MPNSCQILYYANLREQSGLNEETLQTDCSTVHDLYKELKEKYSFTLNTDLLRVAVNNQFVEWNHPIADDDKIIFIPPVSGG